MTELTDEIRQRSRGIYFGLLVNVDASIAFAATKIWIAEFSDKPLYAIRPFIQRLYDSFEISVTRADLQRQLLSSLMTMKEIPDDMVMPDIGEEIINIMESKEKEKIEVQYAGYMIFINEIFKSIKAIDMQAELSVKMNMFDNAFELGMKGELASKTKQWIIENDHTLEIKELTYDQMCKIFHSLYVNSCKYLGPVETDALIVEVEERLEKVLEAKGFSPKILY